jgi:hypothetical protein
MQYIKNHWQGKHSLSLAFGINFLLLSVFINWVEPFTLPPRIANLSTALLAFTFYFITCRVLIYGWQIIGLLRVCDRYSAVIGGNLWARAAQGGVLLSVLLSMIMSFSAVQTLYVYAQQHNTANSSIKLNAAPTRVEPQLVLLEHNTVLHLSGNLAPGTTRRMETLLQHYPHIHSIVLESAGGRVHEGRGLARLIQQYHLATFTLNACSSACTLAFISGSQRTLATGAQLGFHQYHLAKAHPFINVQAEQDKDRAFFQSRRIASDFIAQAFATPHQEIWFPAAHILQDAGVVHAIIPMSALPFSIHDSIHE